MCAQIRVEYYEGQIEMYREVEQRLLALLER